MSLPPCGGRRECRALNRTRNPRGLKRKTPTSRQAGPKSHGTPCAMALRLTPRSPRSPGLLASVATRSLCSLVPSIGGTGPHGLTVRDCAARLAAQRVHRNPRRVSWRSRNAPPERRGLASLNHNFCVSERTIFLRGALDSSGKTGGGFCCVARRVEKPQRLDRNALSIPNPCSFAA